MLNQLEIVDVFKITWPRQNLQKHLFAARIIYLDDEMKVEHQLKKLSLL